MLGLDRGGACKGVAYRVLARHRDTVVAYLRERELVTNVYVEVERPVRLARPGDPVVRALAYIVDRSHTQYAGVLPREALLAFVRDSRGRSGANGEYIVNTVGHMRSLGIRDAVLEWLADRLRHEAKSGSA